jgi:hypothetical protein
MRRTLWLREKIFRVGLGKHSKKRVAALGYQKSVELYGRITNPN